MHDRLGNLYVHAPTNPMSDIGESHFTVVTLYTYKTYETR